MFSGLLWMEAKIADLQSRARALSGNLDFIVQISAALLEATQKKKKILQKVETSHAALAKGVNMCHCKLTTGSSPGGELHYGSVTSLVVPPFNLSVYRSDWRRPELSVSVENPFQCGEIHTVIHTVNKAGTGQKCLWVDPNKTKMELINTGN